MFIDASALVSIIAQESDGDELRKKMRGTKHRYVSGMAIYESVLAIIRLKRKTRAEVLYEVNQFIKLNDIQFVDFDTTTHEHALEAFERFGKGNHPAGLNLGDCFAYACAKQIRQPLLFKGDDFTKTDILKA
jgi:ribonuclease VapC